MFVDVSPCWSDPCQYGGTCTRKKNSFICKCVERYIGTYCDSRHACTYCFIVTSLYVLSYNLLVFCSESN